MNGFDIIAVGPKSGLHLSGDILLFIENVRVPFIVGRGSKTLVDEMFLWVGYRSHSTGRELTLTVAGQRVCAGILHSSVCVWRRASFVQSLCSTFFIFHGIVCIIYYRN